MAYPEGFVLGFDPGGEDHFGWSICEVVGSKLNPPTKPRIGLADDAWHAICEVKKALPNNPTVLAAGIDAPLFWSKKLDRKVDGVLRQALRGTKFPKLKLGGTVQTVNSLRGSCVVQGPLLAWHLRDAWDHLQITESHPRALCHLLDHLGQRNMVKYLTAGLADYPRDPQLCLCGCWRSKKPQERLDDHKRDATLSAISAWAAIQPRPSLPKWHNLYAEYIEEPSPIQPLTIPVSYWMPLP